MPESLFPQPKPASPAAGIQVVYAKKQERQGFTLLRTSVKTMHLPDHDQSRRGWWRVART